MKANICTQCGAPLENNICNYCKTNYDDYSMYESNYEINNTGYVDNITNDVYDIYSMFPIVLIICTGAIIFDSIKKLFGRRCIND